MRRINIASPEFEYVGADPDGYRAGIARLGKLLGARESGISVYELPPGLVMFSTVANPTATVYPDGDKIGIYTGEPETEVVVRRDSGVDYFDGETE